MFATATGSADGTGASARFTGISALAVAADGNLIACDGNVIRRIARDGTVTTIAGTQRSLYNGIADGSSSAAQFNAPRAVAVDAAGNAYVYDAASPGQRVALADDTIRKVTPAGVVTTIAGAPHNPSPDGAGNAAWFEFPLGLTTDPSGNVYVADESSGSIRKVSAGGVVSTLALSDANGAPGPFNVLLGFSPQSIVEDPAGNFFASNLTRIYRITSAGAVSLFAGDPGPVPALAMLMVRPRTPDSESCRAWRWTWLATFTRAIRAIR